MPWVRIDDGFSEHPKWGNASAFEIQWFVFALCYCNRNLTDGFVPLGVANRLIHTDDELPKEALPFNVLRSLEAAGIITPAERRGAPGYLIHDYLKYQPSRREVEREKQHSKERKGRFLERQRNANGTEKEREKNGVQNGVGTGEER